MSSRLARPIFAALLAASVAAQAQPPAAPVGPGGAPTTAKPEEKLFSLKLPDGDIDAILGALENYTGKIILRPAALPTATYNLKIENKPKAEIIGYILTILSMNRIGVAPLGDNALKVVDISMARTEAPEMITGSSFDQPASGKIATKVFQLEFMRVQEFAGMVQTMLNPNLQGLVQLQAANAAIITDSVSNLQRIELLLRDLDRPSGGLKPKFYQVQSAKASDLVTKLRTIISGPLQQQLGQATSFSADDRTNQIILLTDQRQIPFFDDLIEKLSAKADPNTRNDVIFLKHADATEVASLLSQVVNGQTAAAQKANAQNVRPGQVGMVTPTPAAPVVPGAPPAATTPVALPGVSGDVAGSGTNEFSSLITVFPDKRSNALVVSGTVDDLRLLGVLIEKLDTILAQVRLEVVIAEVTLTDNHTSGISQLGMVLKGDKLTGFSGSFPGLSVSDGTVTRSDGTTILSGGFDLAGTVAIGTTPRKGDTTILSVPSITTTHNKEAKFFFGETRPIVTGSTSTPTSGGTNGFSTSSQVTQQEIGTTITVKPLIGIDGSVQLDIKMEISDVGDKVQVDNNTQYVIAKRTANSFTIAQSGEIVVLGGMQRKRDARSTSRLGPIPIIGDLLGARSKEDQRTDLIFFLRPVVLTNTPADNVEAMKRVDALEKRQKDPIKQKLDPNYVPAKPTLYEKVFK